VRTLKIIKFGGSVITRKSDPFTVNVPVLHDLARQISIYLNEHPQDSLIIVHGGGSFGHPLVRECFEKYGMITHECFIRIAHYMMLLNNVVLEILLANRIKAISVPTRSICYVINGEVYCDLTLVRNYVDKGLCPVLFGDVVMDLGRMGYSVLSGDKLVSFIARKLGIKDIILVTDVEGLYTSDPKRNKTSKLIRGIKAHEIYEKVEFSKVSDVTGGMGAKISELIRSCSEGMRILIIGGYVRDNLYNALSMKEFIGTTIWC